MEGRADAMIELRRLVESRDALYRQADMEVSTSGVAPEQIVQQLKMESESLVQKHGPVMAVQGAESQFPQ